MNASISRRQLGAALAAALPVAAQAPPSGEGDKAMEQIHANGKALSAYSLPISTEPAFAFKP